MKPNKAIPGDVTTWSEEMQYLFHERVGMKMDSNTPEYRAEMEARREVWALSQSGELFSEGNK